LWPGRNRPGHSCIYNHCMKRLLPIFLLALSVTARADIPFVEDDFTQALSRAQTKNAPIFVEAWAPW